MTRHTCPRCQQSTTAQWCCGLDLLARNRWRMTADRVRMVHVLARSRKGLTEEQYRLRLAAVNVDTCLKLSRDQFHRLLVGLRSLPDSPRWIRDAQPGRRRRLLDKVG